MESLDAVEVFSYGLAILGFLLLILAYRLMHREQRLERTRPEVIGTVRLFIGITFICILVVALFGIPTIRNFQLLEQINDTLRIEKYHSTALHDLNRNNALILNQEQELTTDSIVKLVLRNEKTLDSLAESLKLIEAQEKDEFELLKRDWDKKLRPILEDSSRSESLQRKQISQEIKHFQKKLDALEPPKLYK